MADSSDNLLKKLIREIHRRSISQVLPILASLTAAGLALEAHEARAQVPSPPPPPRSSWFTWDTTTSSDAEVPRRL